MAEERTPTAGTRAGLLTFFLIAFGIPWTGWIAIRLMPSLGPVWQERAWLWFPASVSLAGFAAAFVDGGLPGLRRFAARVFSLRFAAWLWLVALLLPLFAAALTFVSHPGDLLRGGPPHWAGLWVPLTLLNLWTGPLAEEFGWRGYLLQSFSKRLSPLLAGLAIGPIWALWHVPLFYDGVYAHLGSSLGYIAWVTAWSVVMCLVVSRCRGSVLPSVLIHFLMNNEAGFAAALLPALAGERLPGGLSFALTSVVVAIGLAWLWRKKWAPQPGLVSTP